MPKPRPGRGSGRWRWARSAWSTATSAGALYALREALTHAQAGGVTRAEVLGVTSLLLWALIFIVTVKYVLFLMRADNRGEGSTLSLMALAQRSLGRGAVPVFVLGVTGAALFYGDAMITPAISVLSAVEAKLDHPGVRPLRRPDHGRHPDRPVRRAAARDQQGGGAVRPDHAAWFVVMAVLGLLHLGSDDRGVFAALTRITRLFSWRRTAWSGSSSWAACSSRSPGRALYADMGHFGRGPIRAAWIGLVFPALALNYLGQGALSSGSPTRSPTRSS